MERREAGRTSQEVTHPQSLSHRCSAAVEPLGSKRAEDVAQSAIFAQYKHEDLSLDPCPRNKKPSCDLSTGCQSQEDAWDLLLSELQSKSSELQAQWESLSQK